MQLPIFKAKQYSQHHLILMDDVKAICKIAIKSVILNSSGGFPAAWLSIFRRLEG